MLQPIAFSVMRQALDWHGFPQPTMRQLSFYEWRDTFSAEYLCVWTGGQIQGYLHATPSEDGDFIYTVLRTRLYDCFADDVSVVQLHWDNDNGLMSALLYVQLEKTPYQLVLMPGE